MKKAASRLNLLLLLVVSYYFTRLWFGITYEFRGAPWPVLTAGVAHTPFQYRALIPWIVSALTGLRFGGGQLSSPSSIYFCIEYAFVFSTALALGRYLGFFFGRRRAQLLALSLFLPLPYTYLLDRVLALRYPSDMPALFFFTLGLVLIYRKNWPLYYPLFAVATLNRETSCFLTAAFLFTSAGRENRARIALHVAAQAALWGAIKYWLWRHYAANIGDGLYVFNIRHNLEFLADPNAYPLFLSNFGFLWIPVLVFRRRIQDAFVRRTVWLIPLFFAGMFVVGNMYELRIYGELTPVVISAMLLIMRDTLTPSALRPGEAGREQGARRGRTTA